MLNWVGALLTSDLARKFRMHGVDLPIEMFSNDLFLLLRISGSQHADKVL